MAVKGIEAECRNNGLVEIRKKEITSNEDDNAKVPWQLPVGAEMILKQIAAETIFLDMVDFVIDGARQANHKALFNLLRQFPALCHRTYTVQWEGRGGTRELYPLSILCCLQSPLELLKFVYSVYPPAMYHKESAKGTLPFHYVCTFQGSLEVVDWMIQIDPTFLHTPRTDDMYAAHLAVFFKSPIEVVDRLLEAWPEGVTRDYSGDWSLLHAAAAGQANIELVRRLYNLCPSSILMLDERRRTPLHQACWKTGNLEVVSFLMEKAPQALAMEDDRGETPLFRAVRNQSLDVIKFLLPEDPPLDDMGATLLHFAALDNTVDVVEFLLKTHPNMALRHTLERDRYTPLHSACHFSSNLATIQALVRHNPSLLAARNGHGKTPLDTAKEFNKSKEIIAYMESVTLSLISNEAKFSSDRHDGRDE